MKTLEERLEALVKKARTEVLEQIKLKEETENFVIETCIKALEEGTDISTTGVSVKLSQDLTKVFPEWESVSRMDTFIEEKLLHKVKAICVGIDDNNNFNVRLRVKI